MKKILTILIFLIPVFLLATEPIREWKLTAGKVIITAAWDGTEPENVCLKKDGRNYKLPLANPSEAEQEYLLDLRSKRELKDLERKNSALKEAVVAVASDERMVKTVDGVEFAFRWSPPGSFKMGSPQLEKERYHVEAGIDDETQIIRMHSAKVGVRKIEFQEIPPVIRRSV